MSKKIKLSTAMAIPLVAAVTSVAPQTAFCDFFISSFGTNELMRFNEDTGEYLGVIAEVQGPFASQIGFEGDLFVKNRLVIYSSGKVRGKITYGEIEIERGGALTGEISSGTALDAGKKSTPSSKAA